jgi:predicted nucleic acid-binding Zn ribbon protein
MSFFINRKRKGKISDFHDIITSIIREYKIEKLFTIELLHTIWVEIVGDIMSTHSIPERIQKNILYIAVDHSIYANEIILMKDHVVKKIQERAPLYDIRDIRINVKKLQWEK